MVITNTAASTGTRGARNISDTLTEGKRYRISWTSRVSSGTGQTIALSMFNSSQLAAISKLAGSGAASSVGSPTIYAFTPTGSAERHSLEFILAGGGTDSLYFNLANTGAGEVYNIDNITLKQIGTLADFRAERYDTSTNKLYDLSDNAFVGTGTSVTLTGREVPVYEHGTWTPTLSFSGGSTGITYGANTFGYYTRIGNVVHYSGYLTLTSKGTDTGLVYLGNLPFTVAAATDNHQSGITVGIASAFSGLSGPISGLHLYSDTRVLLYDWGATGTASLDDTNLTNTSSIRFSGTYQIS